MNGIVGSRMDIDGTRPSQTAPGLDTYPQQSDGAKVRKRPLSIKVIFGCLILLILIVALLLIAFPLSAYAYYQINGLIVPGVSLGGLDLGGMTWLEAKNGLEVVYPTDMEIFVTDGTRNWSGNASEFGVGWDSEAMAHEALNVAHGKDFSSELSEMVECLIHGRGLEPISYFNIEAARMALLKWEPTVNIPARDAELKIKDGEVEVIPSETGLVLDVEATLSLLSEMPEAVIETGEIRLVVRSQEPEIPDVSSIRAQAEEILKSSIGVQAYDPVENETYEWDVSREVIGTWLEIQKTEFGYELFLQDHEIEDYAGELSSSLGGDQYLELVEVIGAIRSAMDGTIGDSLRVYHHPTTYLVKPGDTLLEIGWELGFPFWMIMDANPYLYSSPLEYGQELVIPSRDSLMPLPVIPNKRIVISITDQRLRAYQDGEELWDFIISTGIDDSPTQPGVFQVRTHELNAYASVWDLYMPHFMGVYEAWPEFMNGIHGLPMLSSGRRLWANVLGRPASYGCIILTLEDAEMLYNWAEDGVVVEILR